jgi:hypothetical protein
MNYFDNNLVEMLNENGILYERLSDKEQEDLINNIQNKIIFAGSKIDWEALENATELSYMDRPLALAIVAEKLGSLGIQQVIFLSDSAIEHAYSININDIKKALEIFADFPQHTYIFPQSLHWIACLAFEGQIDYADLTHD